MGDRRKLIIASGLGLALVALQQPTADLRIVTHDLRDPAPRQVRAGLDLGLVAFSVLVTWTERQLAR